MNGLDAHHYWDTKLPSGTQKLDNPAMERALNESTLSRHRWVTKHITGHFTHGKNMQRRGQRSTAACPRCPTEVEDKDHILQCPADSARTQWKLSMQTLHRWLKDQGMAIKIRTAIMTNLEKWVTNDTTSSPPMDDFSTEQEQIGWDRMMDGWLTRGWRDHQE